MTSLTTTTTTTNNTTITNTTTTTNTTPPYQFLICIDFEATCDETSEDHPELDVTRDAQEIIEFPWVVLDTSTLEIVGQEQKYILPENTKVTEFCTNLTQITGEILKEQGVSFQEAISSFAEFVNTNYVKENKTFCIVAHGKWDLAQLRYEAKRKEIELEPWMHKFIDLREVFRYWGKVKRRRITSTSLDSMCKALHITFSGQEHSGIDDATNIAKILASIIPDARAAIAAQDETSVESTEEKKKEEQPPRRHDRGPREPRVLPDFPKPYSWLESMAALQEAKDVQWLELSGLPYDANEEDIRGWINECFDVVSREKHGGNSKLTSDIALEKGEKKDGEVEPIVSVCCTLDPNGMRPKGTGYVRCATTEHVVQLFGCSPPPMNSSKGQRSIVLTPASDASFKEQTTRRFKPSPKQFAACRGSMVVSSSISYHVLPIFLFRHLKSYYYFLFLTQFRYM
jgi:inhibitor of KinA sporulation pathway (predicted exonuclease)